MILTMHVPGLANKSALWDVMAKSYFGIKPSYVSKIAGPIDAEIYRLVHTKSWSNAQ